MNIKFELKNCYGIGALNDEVSFGASNIAVIYAPNGTMKTSLKKTIEQLLAGKEPCDEMFKDRESHAAITIDGTAINKENTYVFQNEDADGTKQISTFLANAALKGEYDAIYQLLDGAKKALKKQVKQIAKSSDCEDEILEAFRQNEEDNYFDCLVEIKAQLDGELDILEGYDFKFNDVFVRGGKVKDFISENHDTIQRYFEKYTELIRGSKFFSSVARFGTSQANSLLKSVGDNRYFLAGHKLELGGEEQPKTITSKGDMEDVIQGEMQRIFSDEEIKTLFNDLESKLDKNLTLKGFKDVIQAYPELIPELVDYDEFQRKILRGYLKQCEAELKALTDLYKSKKEELKDIIHRANAERSQWEKVIDLFKKRFHVPFILDLQNKSDILLNSKTPELQFLYKDCDEVEPIQQERKTLVDHLSTGEKKAFFILQNIFELEARRVSGQETLLVFDDIADSFDYKNKYAIVEYLNDLRRDGNFKILILTHNFDFYRTVVSRLEAGGHQHFAEKKGDRSIKMCEGLYSQDILKNKFLKKLDCRRNFIGCIPFVRNIAEYTGGDGEGTLYKQLTLCLHLKPETPGIKMSEIKTMFDGVVIAAHDKTIDFGEENYLNALFDEAEAILTDANEIDIVNKLVLSMAIRMRAEQYMGNVLTAEQVNEIKPNRNRTAELLNILRKYHAVDKENEILLMNKVLMLTSENIHFNNFMFEPLVDISILHLKQLYKEVKTLLGA